MMAVYGNLIVVDDVAGNRLQHRYALPPRAAEALTNDTKRADVGRFVEAAEIDQIPD
jgi:hypothetical protein